MQTATTPEPVIVQVPTRPVTQAEINVIRQQRSEMSEQLTSAIRRRDQLLGDMRDAPPGALPGLQGQLDVLNARIVAIETDIEASGRTLRTGQVPAGTTIVPPRGFNSPTDSAERGAALALGFLVPTIIVYAVMRWRRRRRRNTDRQQFNAEHDARMERLEQAVDAIALEVERVGESQRFQARLLAEANIMPAAGQRIAEPIRIPDR
jgi:hypothetical protein